MWVQRIKKGFHRIGLILASVALMAGAVALLFGAYQWAQPLINPPIFEITAPDGTRFVFRYDTEPKELGQQVKDKFANRFEAIKLVDDEIRRIDSDRDNGLLWMLGSLISLLIAAVLYGASWAIGWVLAAFLGD
jgi:hypothetical protein